MAGLGKSVKLCKMPGESPKQAARNRAVAEGIAEARLNGVNFSFIRPDGTSATERINVVKDMKPADVPDCAGKTVAGAKGAKGGAKGASGTAGAKGATGTGASGEDASTATIASQAPYIRPNLSAFLRQMEDDVAQAMQILADARTHAGRFRIRSLEGFAALLLSQYIRDGAHSRVMGAVASYMGLKASVGAMASADKYRQAALQKGDDAQRAFVAAQPEMQLEIDTWNRLEQTANRLVDFALQVFQGTEQGFGQTLMALTQPSPNFTFN